MHTITPELMAVARGDAPADLLFRNARIVNTFSREVVEGAITVHGGFIVAVGEEGPAAETVDLRGAFVAPGFIDAHMHVESTMMPPSEFIRFASPHGTTGAVLDPHEIANVLGIPGIRYLMDNARGLPLNFMFAASSCVPSSPLETAGAVLTASDLEPLFDEPEVVALAEMMNFPGVFLGVPDVLEKVNLGLRRRLVDGHAPGLMGRRLDAYVAAGITSDHECTTLEEAREKLRRGMQIHIREGSAARNLDALLPLVTESNAHRFCFCTDDRHPGDLRDEGHIDHVIRRAVQAGLHPVTAIAMGSTHVAQHYRRHDLGAIAPGRQADMLVLDDLATLRVRRTYHRGILAAEEGDYVGPRRPVGNYPASGVRLPDGLSVDSLRIPVGTPGSRVHVIGMNPTQLVTQRLSAEMPVHDGAYMADVGRDLLKLVVIERHRASGNIGRGFIHGFRLQSGALASTVGHDSHNLAIVGANDEDMLVAARALASCGGGQCVVRDGAVLALLPLPIAGLMSDQPAETVVAQQAALLKAAHTLGCPHHDPFMPLSFMPLPVIPSLKLTDLGLVDVDAFQVIPLEQ